MVGGGWWNMNIGLHTSGKSIASHIQYLCLLLLVVWKWCNKESSNIVCIALYAYLSCFVIPPPMYLLTVLPPPSPYVSPLYLFLSLSLSQLPRSSLHLLPRWIWSVLPRPIFSKTRRKFSRCWIPWLSHQLDLPFTSRIFCTKLYHCTYVSLWVNTWADAWLCDQVHRKICTCHEAEVGTAPAGEEKYCHETI